MPDEAVNKEWKKRTKNVCKPCWELKYCPYGPLVEQFPTPPTTKREAIEHNNFLKQQLKKNTYKGRRKKLFKREVRSFRPGNYPESRSKLEEERSCTIFGHFCPVFFANEPFTETAELRRISKHVPRNIMLRVVRRDGNICKICGRTVMDHEIEFDHIIPLSKGGRTEESNLRVACPECNRRKKDKIGLELQDKYG
jgi:hypothetical protein